jgi:hypothetical protein
MPLLAILLLAAPAAAPAPAPAVTADTYPTTKGTVGVTFYLPNSVDTHLVGATYFISNDTAARLDVGLNAPVKPSGQSIIFTTSLGLRLFALKHERVGVFLQPAFAFGNEVSPAVAASSAWFIRFGAGAGVEYFFTNRFSVGAVFDVGLKFANISGPGGTPTYITFSTTTSAISANVYF